MIVLEDADLRLNRAVTFEWLYTNGLGGYASSTILGLNVRGYHGLLVSSLNPPVDRWLTLSRLDEVVAGAVADAQIAAGAQSIMLFDTWGGALSTENYQQFCVMHFSR